MPAGDRPPVDTSRPNIARVYDYWRGGTRYFPADRRAAEALLRACPALRDMCRWNRQFVANAVTWAAGQGIRQFLDLGTGLPSPSSPAVHQSARAAAPAARAVYVDNDPVVLLHARRLHAGPGVRVAAADLTDPAAVLAHPRLLEVTDLAEPVCVLLTAVLHLLDAGTARRVCAGYAERTAPGSCLAVTVPRYGDPAVLERVTAASTWIRWWNHSRADVESFLAGLDLVYPGVTRAHTWRAGMPDPALPLPGAYVLAGAGRKSG